ncbi:MAG: hypothetical protein ACPG4Z_08355, partial [Chitinophagales bacterium]
MNTKIKTFLKKKILYILLFLLGVGILLYALSQLSGDILIAISILGGLLMLFAFFKSVKREVEENALDKDRLKRIAEDYEKLKQEHLKVISENKSLHDMKINVSN